MPKTIELPTPPQGLPPIDLSQRQSIRDFADLPITLPTLGAVLFAAQGFRNDEGKRLAPSAGALFPLKVRIAVRNIPDLAAGIYLYLPAQHGLELVEEYPDPLHEVAVATFEAPWLAKAAAALLISAEFERTTLPFAAQPPQGRAERYVWLEAGHVAQNIGLAAAALSLATVFIGGFHDEPMGQAFRSRENEQPIGVMPLGIAQEKP